MIRTDRPLRLVFTTWEGGGSVGPALAAAAKMIGRGHDVRVMSDAANRFETEAIGARFTAWKRAPSRPDRRHGSEIVRDWGLPQPQDGLVAVLRAIMVGPALAYAADLNEELDREPADLVATNELLLGVAMACEARGQKFALLAPNISFFPLPGVPPIGPGLPPARSDEERALHDHIAEASRQLFDTELPTLNAARAALGLGPVATLAEQHAPAAAVLLGTSAAFDFPATHLPPHVRYVGPQISEPAWAAPWVSPWPGEDRAPLVLVGFSTTFQDHGGVLQRVIDALGALPVRALVTLGDAIDPEALATPDNVRLVHSAPHEAVLKEAALVVTHGGHGTIVKTLVHRRPMLVIPHGRDQNDNAVRVTERGAGLALPPSASAEDIRIALSRLLSEPSFAEAAEAFGARVAADVDRSPIVEILEGLAGAGAEAEPNPLRLAS
jgi:MGT family glycosyltransferase